MSTYYVKVGKKYEPVGMSGPELHDGIWLVESYPGSKEGKNLRVRLDDLPDPKDLKVLASTVRLERIICKVMMDCWSEKNNKSCSIADAAIAIAKALSTEEMKLRKLTSKDLRK